MQINILTAIKFLYFKYLLYIFSIYSKQYKKFVNNGTYVTHLALKSYILGTIGTLLSNWEVCNNCILTWDHISQDVCVKIPPSPPGKKIS